MLAKKHEYELNTVLAVCDKEHIGKTFEDGKICFTASERFYNGHLVTEKELIELVKECSSVNLFGNKCVAILEKEGLINQANVILISGIKHAQVYVL